MLCSNHIPRPLMKPIALFILLAAGLLLNGCVNLKPKPDAATLYTLGMNTSPSQSVDTTLPACHIARPELPGYLLGTTMYSRTQAGEITLMGGARWGEDLSEGIARALGEYLQSTGTAFVRSQYPWPKLDGGARDVRVLFERLSASDDGRIEVVANWQIRLDRKTVDEGRFQSTNLTWDTNAPGTYVAQLNKALELLVQDIAKSI